MVRGHGTVFNVHSLNVYVNETRCTGAQQTSTLEAANLLLTPIPPRYKFYPNRSTFPPPTTSVRLQAVCVTNQYKLHVSEQQEVFIATWLPAHISVRFKTMRASGSVTPVCNDSSRQHCCVRLLGTCTCPKAGQRQTTHTAFTHTRRRGSRRVCATNKHRGVYTCASVRASSLHIRHGLPPACITNIYNPCRCTCDGECL